MRKELYRLPEAEALALLGAAHHVHLATVTPDGAPVVRALHAVLDGRALCFHAAPAGEKSESLGQRAVAVAQEVVCQIPSYWVDAERACPATTLYRSVQVHGTLAAVTDPARKARVMAALMQRFQPEGGHAPLDPESPLYATALRTLLVFELPFEQVDGKGKLAQNRSAEERERILRHLWQRGDDGDLAAVELVRRANPGDAVPGWMVGPRGTTLCVAPGAADADAVAALLAGRYWTAGASPTALAAAHRASTAWLVLRDGEGAVVASARALSDGARRAAVFDVVVRDDRQRQGLGRFLVERLLEHPRLRAVERITLGTRDAAPFYGRLGFAAADARGVATMVRARAPAGTLT